MAGFLDAEKLLSTRAKSLNPSAIREIFKYTGVNGIISLAGGYPEPGLFPLDKIRQAVNSAIDKYGPKMMQYSPTQGVPEFLEYLRWFMREKEGCHHCDEESVMVVSASQQALSLLSQVLIDPGDIIIVEEPTYVGGLVAFRSMQARFVGVPMDENGMDMDILEQKLKKHRAKGDPVKAIYTIPTFQNPAGYMMSVERRRRLVELAKEYNVLVIEDDPYGYLVYEGERPPTIKSFDDASTVIYLSTYSKTLVPGFRLGFAVGHPEVIRKMIVAKQAADLCTAAFVQYATLEYMNLGFFEEHLKTLIESYGAKMRVMLDALQEHFGDVEGVKWSVPKGGFFIWMELPEWVDTYEMFRYAVDAGVVYVYGSAFYPYPELGKRNTLRLNFSLPTADDIKEGIRRLRLAYDKYREDRAM
ncbi:MAG: PLP-dependent aminotransferase family protein [Dictyoglomi bacterium]|nr:PLP-dependent aminotransferase family protein [Dictyoglomota bacterium]